MPQIDQGLSSSEAARRLADDGPNELPGSGPRATATIVIEVVTEPMFLLLLAAAAIYLVLGSLREALVLTASVAVILITTIVQERRTEHTLARLRDLTSPRALVIRDGVSTRIAGRDVVAGDVALLQEGDRVAADGIVLSATALSVDESILTGESLPSSKTPKSSAADASSSVYSGSMVVSGYGVMEVTATGTRSEIGKIGQALRTLQTEITPLKREVTRLTRWVAIGGLSLCTAIAVIYAITHHDWLGGVLAGITVAMSALPEEFPVVLTVFLAMGAWRISKHRVLVRRMPAIETIGAVTVLAVDKTGTLTENRMRVALIETPDATYDLRSHASDLDAAARNLLSTAAAASEQDAFDPMERAIHESATTLASLEAQTFAQSELVYEYDLTPQLLAVTHAWRLPNSSELQIAMKGAPETIFALCRLDAKERDVLLERVAQLASEGLRVLAVASGIHRDKAVPDSPRGFEVRLLGLLCLADPIRPTVPDALAECKRAGIRVIMITGDHRGTALAIAKQAGFDTKSGAVNCADIKQFNDKQLQELISTVNVYARATPEDKLRLVRAFKANGEVIAMTGDGVNDAPALKAAHVGVAMGSRGTDVAREAASLILLDDDFASLVRAVRLGRRIYSNIRHAMYYIVAVHVPTVGMGLLPVLFGWPLLLYPLHVVFLEFVIDPACSFVFEADRETNDVMSKPPRAPDARIFSLRSLQSSFILGLTALAFAVIVYGLSLARLYETQARALAFAALVIGNIAVMLFSRTQKRESLFNILRQPNPAFWLIVLTSLGALTLVIYIPAIAGLFRISSPPAFSLALVIAAALVSLVAHEARGRLTRR